MNHRLLSHVLLSAFLFATKAINAEEPLAELVRPILAAGQKPFAEFVQQAVVVSLPALPSPSETDANPLLDNVRDLLWKRVSSLDLAISQKNRVDALKNLTALRNLRIWLLRNKAYTNLVFASYIEETVPNAAIYYLAEGALSPKEAKEITANFNSGLKAKEILMLLEPQGPSSEFLQKKLANSNQTAISMIDILGEAYRMSENSNEELELSAGKLIKKESAASAMAYVAAWSGNAYFANLLVDYVEKGGNLALPRAGMAADIAKRMPEVMGEIDPFTGIKIYPITFCALLDRVRAWKSKSW